jgi:hypothetical protein
VSDKGQGTRDKGEKEKGELATLAGFPLVPSPFSLAGDTFFSNLPAARDRSYSDSYAGND